MESLTWTSPRTRATFGTTPETAETTKELAFNQGFYNLFLAIVTAVGMVAVFTGHRAVGAALVFAGVGSMLAAAAGATCVLTRQGSCGCHARNFPADRDRAPSDRVDDVASLCEAMVGRVDSGSGRARGWVCAQCGRSRSVRAVRRRRRPPAVSGMSGDGLADGVHHPGKGSYAEAWNYVVPPDDPIRSSPYDIITQAKLRPSPDAVQPTVAKTTQVCAYDRPNTRPDGADRSTDVPQPHSVQQDVDDVVALINAAATAGAVRVRGPLLRRL